MRMRGENMVIVSPSKHYWYRVQFQSIESLLRHIIIAERVLEAEVELVVGVDEVEAGVVVRPVPGAHTPGVATPLVPTVPVNVHANVPLEQPHVLHTPVVVVTVGNEPDNRGGVAHFGFEVI